MREDIKLITYRADPSDIKALKQVSVLYRMNMSEAIRYLVKRELEDIDILNSGRGEFDPVEMASLMNVGVKHEV